VIKHIWLRVEHCVQRRFVAVEVWNQNFNLALWIQETNFAYCRGPMCGAAIRQVVAID
jgi:hypothetical protein